MSIAPPVAVEKKRIAKPQISKIAPKTAAGGLFRVNYSTDSTGRILSVRAFRF
jgi:hypothetical protein